jgi:hypothetical protein
MVDVEPVLKDRIGLLCECAQIEAQLALFERQGVINAEIEAVRQRNNQVRAVVVKQVQFLHALLGMNQGAMSSMKH